MMRLFTLFALVSLSITSLASVSESITTDAPAAKPAHPQPYKSKIISRGQLLYENHCLVCHTSVVHIRSQRKAASIGAIRSWVIRWSAELDLKWSIDDINDVATYLNQRYYQFTE